MVVGVCFPVTINGLTMKNVDWIAENGQFAIVKTKGLVRAMRVEVTG